jgi:hypothetical protein
MTVWLALQAVLFAGWVLLAFRTLFRLRSRAVAESGTAFPGLRATLAAFAGFLRDPGFARERRLLAVLTAALLAMSAASSVLLP